MSKTKIISLIAGLAALAVAVPAVGAPPAGKAVKGQERAAEARAKGMAKRTCQLERKEIGREAFREKYGDPPNGRRAMRNCKRTNGIQVLAAADDSVQNCRDERAADPDAFREKYGTNSNGKNAFGKCVSSSLRNAAKECKAEREADPEAFDETYGTNSNDRNAFGKCVSQKVNEEPEPEPEPEPTV
jgi:hypothetical protein